MSPAWMLIPLVLSLVGIIACVVNKRPERIEVYSSEKSAISAWVQEDHGSWWARVHNSWYEGKEANLLYRRFDSKEEAIAECKRVLGLEQMFSKAGFHEAE